VLNYEEQQLQPDGTVSWLIRNKVPLHDRDGNVIGVLGTIQNITESIRIKEALRFTRFSVDQAVFPIFWLDEEGRFSYMNDACGYLGFPKEELGAMTIFDITPELYRENWPARWKEIIDKGFDTFERFHKTKSGSLVPVELTVHPVEHNGRVFLLSYVRDISERKMAEERIKKQLERLAALRAIDEAISASLNLKVTLNVVLDLIIAQLDADAADILLLNHAYKLRHAASRGFRTKALRHTSLAIGKGNAGLVAMEMRTIHIPDVRNGENPFKNAPLLYEEGFVSYYGIPLIAKGQTVGVLEIFFKSAQKLEQERLDFLETMAGHAAIAIDNATLFTGLQKSNLELTLAYDSTLEGWSRALDMRDRETEGHSQRVTDMTEHIAKIMDVPESDIMHMRRGAILHDIGKMGIPDHILLKSGPLDEQESAIMQRHPLYAYEFLSQIAFLHPALEIPYCHHEKWDGSGYPRGLKGKQIPLSARIFAIVDVWDALRSDRPYRSAWSFEKTRDYILGLAGTHFDPRVVEVFKSYLNDLQ
jgi:PAS domain S-box-containing protein